MIFSFGVIVLLVDYFSFLILIVTFDAAHCMLMPIPYALVWPMLEFLFCSALKFYTNSKYVQRSCTRRLLFLSIFRFDCSRSTANKTMAHNTLFGGPLHTCWLTQNVLSAFRYLVFFPRSGWLAGCGGPRVALATWNCLSVSRESFENKIEKLK